MEKYGKLIDDHTLQFERLLPGPIEKVWEHITDGDKRSKWFCGGTSGEKAGDKIKFVFNNSQLGSSPEPTPKKYKEFGDGYESHALVIEAVKPKLFVIEWDGIVRFELTKEGENVRLVLTHEKLPDSKETKVGAMAGWHTHLDILVDQMNETDSPGFWGVHMGLEEEYYNRI